MTCWLSVSQHTASSARTLHNKTHTRYHSLGSIHCTVSTTAKEHGRKHDNICSYPSVSPHTHHSRTTFNNHLFFPSGNLVLCRARPVAALTNGSSPCRVHEFPTHAERTSLVPRFTNTHSSINPQSFFSSSSSRDASCRSAPPSPAMTGPDRPAMTLISPSSWIWSGAIVGRGHILACPGHRPEIEVINRDPQPITSQTTKTYTLVRVE